MAPVHQSSSNGYIARLRVATGLFVTTCINRQNQPHTITRKNTNKQLLNIIFKQCRNRGEKFNFFSKRSAVFNAK